MGARHFFVMWVCMAYTGYMRGIGLSRVMCAFLLVGALGLGACAGRAPVPGGSDLTNPASFTSQNDFKERVGRIKRGMTEAEVWGILGQNSGRLERLDRPAIMLALYGTSQPALSPDAHDNGRFIASLSGYRVTYKEVEREHGLSSPIRLRTDAEGFLYTVTMIFWDGYLYEPPILAGGPVKESNSRTIFDALNPFNMIGRPF